MIKPEQDSKVEKPHLLLLPLNRKRKKTKNYIKIKIILSSSSSSSSSSVFIMTTDKTQMKLQCSVKSLCRLIYVCVQ